MTEATLVNRILRALNTLPRCKAIKLHGNPYVEKGTPDIHATVRGRSVWLEVKLPGGEPTRLQARRLLEWRQAGAVWAIVHSIEEALQIVWQRLWNAGRMDAEWAKQMREAWEIPGYPGVITLLESAARLCRDNGFRSHANEIDAFLERCRPLLKPETEIGGD